MKSVVGLFANVNEAESAKQQLISQGFSAGDINVMAKQESAVRSAGAGSTIATDDNETGIGHKIGNFFRSLTGGEDDSNYYESTVNKGGVLVAVTVADNQADRTADLLERLGARDIDENNKTPQPVAGAKQAFAKGEQNTAIPVVEEQMKVGKREVQRGGIRVYSHVTERPVEENIRLREEHIHVDRRPVDRPATEADFTTGLNRRIELTETAEEAVVSKSSRVVEEIVIGKDATERSETVRDTVRNTEVEVEKVGASGTGRAFSDYDADFRRDFQTNYASRGGSYDRYRPAYQYGYTLANDPRYKGRDWSQVEQQAKSDWSAKNGGTWDDFKQAVRGGWDKVTGK